MKLGTSTIRQDLGGLPPPIDLALLQTMQTSHEHREDSRWQLVQRIVASRSFGRSPLLSEFLLYISDRHIRGKASQISEQQIGVKVFGRAEGYNSNDDNIVRNYARTLRKRVQEYFEIEGRFEELRLEIPRGGYVPVFAPNALNPPFLRPESTLVEAVEPPAIQYPEAVPPTPPDDPAQPLDHALPAPAPHASRSRWTIALTALASLLVGFLLAHNPGSLWLKHAANDAPEARLGHSLWSHLFEQQRDTFIVPADGGLVMMKSFLGQPISLEDYMRGTYRNTHDVTERLTGLAEHLSLDEASLLTRKIEILGARRTTSIVDLDLTAHLSRLPEVVPERLMIRYARDLRIDDLRTGNVILLGSSDANPWVELFQQQLNFQFANGVNPGGSQVIVNQRPLPGEASHYASESGDPSHQTYGVLAYVPNLEGTGHVLIVEGVNMAGTQAAGAFLLSPALMLPVLQHATTPGGAIRPFEILLATSDVAANASRPKILSERIGTLP